jgi:hypothetical protein
MSHKKVDLCITNSGDLILVPEWVDRASWWNGVEYTEHPLAGRAGDLLLSNELHYLDPSSGPTGTPQILLADGTIPQDVYEYLKKDIEADAKRSAVYREVNIDIESTVFSKYDKAVFNDEIRSFIQEIIMRVMTNSPDLEFHTSIGANLEDLMGEWNTRTVAEWGLNGILNQLNNISMMNVTQSYTVHTDDFRGIEFHITIKGPDNNNIVMSIEFDFEEGFVIRGNALAIDSNGVVTVV